METVITEYGFFDSRIKFPTLNQSKKRAVEEYELELYTKTSSAKTFLNENAYPLKNGMIVFARPGDSRYSTLPFQCYYFHFRTDEPALLDAIGRIPSCLLLGDPEEMRALFLECIGLSPAERPEDELLLKALLFRILYRLVGESRAPSGKKSAAFAYRREFAGTEQYIKTHLTGKLDLKTLAARINLSPVYFHKLFSSYFGTTPGAFILAARVEAAKSALAAGEKDLAKIARECGFSSQSYFTTKFREATGATPMAYRKSCLSRLEP